MTAPIPPVQVSFTANQDPVTRAVQELVQQLKTVQREGDRTRTGAEKLAAGFKLAGEQAAFAATGSGKFADGLARLKVQQEAQAKATASAAATQSKLTDLVGLATKGLGALGISYSAVKVLDFVKDSVDAAAALHDLAQQTGATVETLSVLEFAGKRNNISAEDLGVAFRQLAKALSGVKGGSADAVAAFGKIGLSARDLEGLTVDEAFRKIANAIAVLPDGFDKAAIASDIFGRSGAQLIPLLNELAGNGFDRVTAAAGRANAVVSKKSADAADEFKDSLDDLIGALGGVARTVATPFLPILTATFKALAEGSDRTKELTANLQRLQGSVDGGKFEDLRKMMGLGPLPGAPGTPQPAPQATITNIGHRAAQLPQISLEQEIKALATLREAGTATAKELARIAEIVVQLNKDLANTSSVEKRADLTRQIASLTKDLTREVSDGSFAAAREMGAMREELERVLAAAAKLADSKVFDKLKELQQNQRNGFLATVSPGVPSSSELAARGVAERAADTDTLVRNLIADEQTAIDGAEQLGKSLRDAIAADLSDFFRHGIADAENFGDAIASLGRTIVNTINDIVSQLLAAQIVAGIAGLFAGGIPKAPGGFGDLGTQAAAAPKLLAGGGFVTGAGGPTDDRVPAMLSAGEFVVRAAAVRQYGVEFFQSLNGITMPALARYDVPRLAQGGVVTAPARGGRSTVVLEAPAGWSGRVHSDDDTIDVIIRHRRKIAQTLGVKA